MTLKDTLHGELQFKTHRGRAVFHLLPLREALLEQYDVDLAVPLPQLGLQGPAADGPAPPVPNRNNGQNHPPPYLASKAGPSGNSAITTTSQDRAGPARGRSPSGDSEGSSTAATTAHGSKPLRKRRKKRKNSQGMPDSAIVQTKRRAEDYDEVAEVPDVGTQNQPKAATGGAPGPSHQGNTWVSKGNQSQKLQVLCYLFIYLIVQPVAMDKSRTKPSDHS